MQQKKKQKLVSLKELIAENKSKFPLNFRSLTEQKIMEEEHANVNCSFYKTTQRTVLAHHFPISKPPIF
jgi:hypothetical protein